MKKVVIAVLAVFIVALSFWAGGHYGQGSSAGFQAEPVAIPVAEGQETPEMPLSPGAVRISPTRQQLIGVQVAAVEKKPLTYTLRLYGRVVPDETRTYRVNASTDCWIRQLSDVTTGSIVQKDQILAEALAPAYYNAQLTYLIALDNIDRIKQQLGGQLRHQQLDLSNNQIRMAVQALQNLGITDAQTEELANTRRARPYLQVRSPADGVVLERNISLQQWLKAADAFYTIADIGEIWVYADVYEDEAMHMRPGMTVAVRHAQMGETFRASVGEVLPLFDPAARTLKVRIDVDNPRYDLRPDMFVDVEIPIAMPASVNVSADAVLDSGTQAIVYVEAEPGAFEPRRVKIGWRLGGRVEILGGLTPGEKVAVSGNFLIDSESRMELASLGPETRVSADPVCGRFVDEEEAEMLELTASHADRTFYFCSEDCKNAFEKEPEKFVRQEQPDGSSEIVPCLPGQQRTWADLLDPVKRAQNAKEGGAEPIKEVKDSPLRNYSTTPEVVDWNGPDKEGAPPPEWSPGWGGFPGAKYLGIKHNISKAVEAAVPASDASETNAKSNEMDAAAPSSDSAEANMKQIEKELKELEEYLKAKEGDRSQETE